LGLQKRLLLQVTKKLSRTARDQDEGGRFGRSRHGRQLPGRSDHKGTMFLIAGKSAARRSVCYNRQTAIGLTRLA